MRGRKGYGTGRGDVTRDVAPDAPDVWLCPEYQEYADADCVREVGLARGWTRGDSNLQVAKNRSGIGYRC